MWLQLEHLGGYKSFPTPKWKTVRSMVTFIMRIASKRMYFFIYETWCNSKTILIIECAITPQMDNTIDVLQYQTLQNVISVIFTFTPGHLGLLKIKRYLHIPHDIALFLYSYKKGIEGIFANSAQHFSYAHEKPAAPSKSKTTCESSKVQRDYFSTCRSM